MKPGRVIIWSPDPSSAEALTAVLCCRVSYDEGVKWQVNDSPPLDRRLHHKEVQDRDGGKTEVGAGRWC